MAPVRMYVRSGGCKPPYVFSFPFAHPLCLPPPAPPPSSQRLWRRCLHPSRRPTRARTASTAARASGSRCAHSTRARADFVPGRRCRRLARSLACGGIVAPTCSDWGAISLGGEIPPVSARAGMSDTRPPSRPPPLLHSFPVVSLRFAPALPRRWAGTFMPNRRDWATDRVSRSGFRTSHQPPPRPATATLCGWNSSPARHEIAPPKQTAPPLLFSRRRRCRRRGWPPQLPPPPLPLHL